MVEALEYENEVYLKFITIAGDQLTIPYADVIHLRRFFYDQDIFAEDNTALLPTLELINTINQGVSNAVETSASLRGIIKATGILSDKDRTKTKDDFVNDYLSAANNGGIAVLDSKFDYIPLKSEPVLINKAQMDAIKTQVYDYFNINTDVVQSKWNEDGWNAFYEGVLEPLAIQMSLEFTFKLFTPSEIAKGNKIVFEANRLAYASNQTKISLVKEVGSLGGFTINEIRELFNMAPIDGGEVRLQTLNVVNAALADNYQTGKEVDDDNTDTEDSE
jgi:HK97 family phage portal protein